MPDQYRRNVNHPVYGQIDSPCIKLCDEVNKLPGLRTTYSCGGHGDHGFHLFITADTFDSFAPILEAIQRAKNWDGEFSKWIVELIGDRGGDSAHPNLHSHEKGEKVYKEADLLAWIIERSMDAIKL